MAATMPSPCVATHSEQKIRAGAELRTCERCAEPYEPRTPWQRFDTTACRIEAWEAMHPRRGRKGKARPETRRRRLRRDRRRELLAQVAAIGRLNHLPTTEVLRLMVERSMASAGFWAAVEVAKWR